MTRNNNTSATFPPEYPFGQRIFHRLAADARVLYERTHPTCMPPLERTIDPEKASDMIFDCLSSEKPSMIARFGASELDVLANYCGVMKGPSGWWDFITTRQDQWWWTKSRIDVVVENAGFFPKKEWAICKYSELFLQDIPYIDVLASWYKREYLFNDMVAHMPKLHLLYLEPWFAKKPWTRVLEGKKVLVVHPFAELISRQYREHRQDLFPGTGILPLFELKTVKAVQSMGGVNPDFTTWFDALRWMEDKIDEQDYDFCLIGCGAYGLHLAAHVKRSGKKAVHMGGVLQMLFGIKGNRWEDPTYGLLEVGVPRGWYRQLFNEYWIKPDASYRPQNADRVEGACYW